MRRLTLTEIVAKRVNAGVNFVRRLFAGLTPGPDGPGGGGAAAHAPGRNFERIMKTSPGDELNLDIQTGGAVHVQGWDQNSVLVRAELTVTDWRDTQVFVERRPGSVCLRSERVAGRMPAGLFNHSFNVWVPRHYNLLLNSAGGRLTIADLEGTFRGSTAGGKLSIVRACGHAELSTGNGEIQVEDSDLTGSVTTENGPVRLSRVSGGLRASSRTRQS